MHRELLPFSYFLLCYKDRAAMVFTLIPLDAEQVKLKPEYKSPSR